MLWISQLHAGGCELLPLVMDAEKPLWDDAGGKVGFICAGFICAHKPEQHSLCFRPGQSVESKGTAELALEMVPAKRNIRDGVPYM
jgi:hypothetical protein